MVKIINRSGEEEKFDSKDVERQLETAGLPERVAKEVAERVEDRVQDGWTNLKVQEQIDIELKRLEEDIQRADRSFERSAGITSTHESTTASANRTETFVPENERERHDRR